MPRQQTSALHVMMSKVCLRLTGSSRGSSWGPVTCHLTAISRRDCHSIRPKSRPPGGGCHFGRIEGQSQYQIYKFYIRSAHNKHFVKPDGSIGTGRHPCLKKRPKKSRPSADLQNPPCIGCHRISDCGALRSLRLALLLVSTYSRTSRRAKWPIGIQIPPL